MYILTHMFVFSPARVWRLKLALKILSVLGLLGIVAAFALGGVANGVKAIEVTAVLLVFAPVVVSTPWDEIDNQQMIAAHEHRQQWERFMAEQKRRHERSM